MQLYNTTTRIDNHNQQEDRHKTYQHKSGCKFECTTLSFTLMRLLYCRPNVSHSNCTLTCITEYGIVHSVVHIGISTFCITLFKKDHSQLLQGKIFLYRVAYIRDSSCNKVLLLGLHILLPTINISKRD